MDRYADRLDTAIGEARLRLVAGRQASSRGVSMRTLRGFLKAHWGKITCLLLGVGLVVGGGYYLWDQEHFAVTAAHADGIVVGHTLSASHNDHGSSTTYCPVVRFFTERKQPIEFRSSVCTGGVFGGPPAVGASVKVLYDPDNPHHAKLDTTWASLTRWGFASGMILVGLLVAAGSIFAIALAVWRKTGRRRGGAGRPPATLPEGWR
jgi:hypothetical protein